MSATAVVVSVSVVVILMIATVVTLLWRTRVGGRRRETPEARYRREMTDLQPTAQTWRGQAGRPSQTAPQDLGGRIGGRSRHLLRRQWWRQLRRGKQLWRRGLRRRRQLTL